MTTKKWLLVIAGAAILLRLIYILIHDPIPQPYQLDLDEIDFSYLGQNVAEGNGFTDKYGDSTTTRFPLYPLFLGIIYYLFGYHIITVFILQALLGAATPILAYYICREYFSEKISMFAARIAAVYPSYIEYAAYLMSENLFIPEIAFLILISIRLVKNPDWKKALWLGIGLGLASLTRGTAFPLALLSPLILLIAVKEKFPIRLKSAAAAIGGVILIMTPWIIRNYAAYGKFLMSSSGGGPILWMSYFPIPAGNFFQIDRAYAYVDSVGRKEAKLEEFHRILVEDNVFGLTAVKWYFARTFPEIEFSDNEVVLDQQIKQLLFAKLRAHPEIVLIKHIKETLKFWHFVSGRGDYVIAYGLILPFFLAGVWLLRKRWREFCILGLFFLYIWILEAMFMSASRYRLSFEVIMIVIGTYAIWQFFTKVKPIYLPIILSAALLSVNIYFSVNDFAFRGMIRSAAQFIGLPVQQNDASFFPERAGGGDAETKQQIDEINRQ